MEPESEVPKPVIGLRHGFVNDPSHLEDLQSHYYSHWDLKRNTSSADPAPEDELHKITDWKSQSNKRKTTTAALVLCLNIGVPPPDIQRPHDCPVMESFVDPTQFTDLKRALQAIGKNLQNNYESISSRTKYKQSLDPSVEDLKRLCTTIRRSTKDERILFHYNGHGVPQPTASGEIWVFNRGYTQYIPVSLYDLQSWIGAPCIFVIDTSAAGNVIENNKKFIQKRISDEANNKSNPNTPSPVSSFIESIQLGACRSNEILPLNPDLPADLFSCCLTSPIEMSIRWFLLSSPLAKNGYYDSLKTKDGGIYLKGKLTDRKTPLGELNWIFTAITDTIAWTSLSRPLFKKLFRQDLMVAALFRNFLLAKKIMPLVGCHPISDPPLPNINDHPMWESWELALDEILAQLVKMKQQEDALEQDNPESINLNREDERQQQQQQSQQQQSQQVQPQQQQQQQQQQQNKPQNNINNGNPINGNTNNNVANGNSAKPNSSATQNGVSKNPNDGNKANNSDPSKTIAVVYQNSTFFEHHLTAFEVWLDYGANTKEPPQQLPIVLQVLLSQAHRYRALKLLLQFLDLGPWAVYLALSIGIFPYILRLLQSPALDLKPLLTFIWARIMAVDYKNTQQELCKDRGYNYFVSIFTAQAKKDNVIPAGGAGVGGPINAGFPNIPLTPQQEADLDEQRAMCAFILAIFVKDFKEGQRLCFSLDLVKVCIHYIDTADNPLLRQWSALLICELLANHEEAISTVFKSGLNPKILSLLNDPIPEIRASIIDVCSSLILIDNKDGLDGDNNSTTSGVTMYNNPMREELNKQDIKVAIEILNLVKDGSPLIRREVICFYSRFVVKYISFFIISAYGQFEEEIILIDDPSLIDSVRRKSLAYGSIFSSIWKVLLILSEDPHDEVKNYAEQVVDYVIIKLNESRLKEVVQAMQEYLLQKRSVGLNASGAGAGAHGASGTDNIKQHASCNSLSTKHKNDEFLNSLAAAGGGNTGGVILEKPISNTNTNTIAYPYNRKIRNLDSVRRSQSMNIGKSEFNPNKSDDHTSLHSVNSSLSERFLSNISLSDVFKNLTFGLIGDSGHDSNKNNNDTSDSMSVNFSGLLNNKKNNNNLQIYNYGTEPRPTTPRFTPKPKDEKGKPILPLKSQFFEYSTEYFKEPQIHSSEADQPGSIEFTKREWRRNRNEGIISETQPQKELALTNKWSNVYTTLENNTQPRIIKFTQFENYLVCTDEKDNVSTFDWNLSHKNDDFNYMDYINGNSNSINKNSGNGSTNGYNNNYSSELISLFSNGNPLGTKITDVGFLNEDDIPLLMIGTSDGIVKIYKNFYSVEECQLISAWRALPDMILAPRSIGLISEWQQSRGSLLVTGDAKVIKIWDAPREKCLGDIPIRSTSAITSLTSDQVSGDIIVGGFYDGSIRVYDRRKAAEDSMVMEWKNTTNSGPSYLNRTGFNLASSIKNVHMQRGGTRELISGSADGFVKLWDIRYRDPVLEFRPFNKTSMTTALIHEHAPIIACASKEINVYSTKGSLVDVIKGQGHSSLHSQIQGLGNSVVGGKSNGGSNGRGAGSGVGGGVSSITSGVVNSLTYGGSSSNSYINALDLHPHRMMMASNYNQSKHINIYRCSETVTSDFI